MSSRPKEFQSRSSTSSKPEKDAAVFINLRTCSELYKKQKVDIQKLHQILIPTHSRSMNLKTRTRRYGKNIGRCAFWNSSRQTAALGWNGHNSLVRNQFWANKDSLERKIRALRNGAMFQYRFYSGNWKKKFVMMRQQWDNEELKEATTTWSNDWDHDLVQEEVEGKLRQQRWRHIENDIHTHEGRTSRIARWSIFSFHA